MIGLFLFQVMARESNEGIEQACRIYLLGGGYRGTMLGNEPSLAPFQEQELKKMAASQVDPEIVTLYFGSNPLHNTSLLIAVHDMLSNYIDAGRRTVMDGPYAVDCVGLLQSFDWGVKYWKSEDRKMARVPLVKAVIAEWRTLLAQAAAQTKLVNDKIRSLPKIPESLINKSERLYEELEASTGMNIHTMKLNFLKGETLYSHVDHEKLKEIRQFEYEFVKRGIVLTHDAYVFRGVKVPSLEALKLDVETITFVTWEIGYAMRYFTNPWDTKAGNDWISVLMVIRLLPGTPVMRTTMEDELVLPFDYSLHQTSEEYLTISSCRERGSETGITSMIGKPGTVIWYECLPSARSRISTIKRYGTGLRSQGFYSVKKRMTTMKSKSQNRATKHTLLRPPLPS